MIDQPTIDRILMRHKSLIVSSDFIAAETRVNCRSVPVPQDDKTRRSTYRQPRGLYNALPVARAAM